MAARYIVKAGMSRNTAGFALHPGRARSARLRHPELVLKIARYTKNMRPSVNPLDEGSSMPRHLGRLIVGLAVAALAVPALAQQPSQEQIAAVRASCRSDFLSLCSGVPRGGAEALQCLKRNAAQLSPACQAAVNAIAAAAPRPETRPAPAAQPPAAAPAPEPTPTAAPPSAPAETAPAPVATAPTAPPSRKRVATPPKPGRPVVAAPAAPPPTMEPTSLGPIPPLPPRIRLMILRACAAEHQTMCANVPPGGGRIVECLAANGSALSAGCRDTILSVK
jgi:hypothetical protein